MRNGGLRTALSFSESIIFAQPDASLWPYHMLQPFLPPEFFPLAWASKGLHGTCRTDDMSLKPHMPRWLDTGPVPNMGHVGRLGSRACKDSSCLTPACHPVSQRNRPRLVNSLNFPKKQKHRFLCELPGVLNVKYQFQAFRGSAGAKADRSADYWEPAAPASDLPT